MQVMVKDSKKYGATGGWGFGDFTDGKPADEAQHKTCFPCHEPAQAQDFVYTRFAHSIKLEREPSPAHNQVHTMVGGARTWQT
jgi:hypothetical protein